MCSRIALILFALTLNAQRPSGEIRVEVKDPSGSAMAASGKLQGPLPAASRSFQTDAHGISTFVGLPYGSYKLDISKKGFATQSLSIEVQSATPVSRTVTMTLGQGPASSVTVITTTPLPGVDLDRDQVAAPVQTADQLDIEKSGAANLSDFMNRRLNGVYLNEVQGNAFQPDLNYRGYTASFIGFAPADKPALVMSVTIQDPKGIHFGGLLGAPIFKKVISFALKSLSIPPTGQAPTPIPLDAQQLGKVSAVTASGKVVKP